MHDNCLDPLAVFRYACKLWLFSHWSAATLSVHCAEVFSKELDRCEVGKSKKMMLGTTPVDTASGKQNLSFITVLCQITSMAAPYTQV